MDETLAPDEAKSGDSADVSVEDRAGTRNVMTRISIGLVMLAREGMSTTALYNGVLHALIAFDQMTLRDGRKSELPAVLRAFADEIDAGRFVLQYLKTEGEA